MNSTLEYVVFDLETNADLPDRRAHEIIQIGAVAKRRDTDELDEFNTLVRPRRKLAAHITALTGLEHGDLGNALPQRTALAEFFRWVADRPMIAHNGLGYDFIVLDSAAARSDLTVPSGKRLDTLQLAHIVYPRAGDGMVRNVDGTHPPAGRSLDHLAKLIGLEARDKHDALNDSHVTHRVMLEMLDELDQATPVRRLQRWLLGHVGHPWAAFVSAQPEPVPLEDVVPEASIPDQIVASGSLDVGAIVDSFGEGGSLMTAGRKPRPQQSEMAELVATAFASPERQRMMIEAPTGTGKTLAYLVPAIAAARASGRTSVVTPHTRVLQDQILNTLEDLQSHIEPFTSVMLKGRQNYISVESLQNELDWLADERADATADTAAGMALAILCGWVSQTPTGDWADLRTAAVDSSLPVLEFLRWKLRVDVRPGPPLSRLARRDFYRQALNKLQTAHVAVLNHALLASGSVMPARGFSLLIDEAHDLEDSATAAATREVSLAQLEMLCEALWDPTSGRGLVARIAAATAAGLRDPHIDRLRSACISARTAIAGLSAPLIEYVRDRTGVTREEAARYGASHRIVRGADRRHASYRSAQDAGRVARNALRGVADALDEIDIGSELRGHYRRDALEDEKSRLGREARNAAMLIDAVLWAETQLSLLDDDLSDDELVEWINVADARFESLAGSDRWDPASAPDPSARPEAVDEEVGGAGAAAQNGIEANVVAQSGAQQDAISAGSWHWSLRRIPLSVAGLLSELWNTSHSVVLTSATLRVGDGFSYLIGRLGLGSVDTRLLSSPFEDLDKRHLVLFTDYLPAPRGQLMDRFTELEAAEIPRLCVASDGGAMALMTARARLERVRDHARAHLERLGIELLAQGDGTSAALVQRMKADPKSCLLGLRSFWEGVDIAGDALRLLLIEKIPFDPVGDPVVSARMDLLEKHGRDPFADYLVPRAAIAFAQGVGRLIRTESDTGVTVVLDNRLCRPVSYADVMKRSLIGPPKMSRVDAPRKAYEAIADHLDLPFDDQRQKRIESVAGVETLSRAALDVGDPNEPLDEHQIMRRLDLAREWLGFDEWRPGQLEVMARFMRGEDVAAVLPTGSGKSVTYQIPALVSPGVTLVVSPLIALMRDQVDNLKARGVNEVAALYSGVGQAEQLSILSAAADGHIKLLYVSPERLFSPVFRDGLKQVDVARIAVDEAHCLSLWGHSFRPEYAMIPRAIEEISGERRPISAVTATATPEVRDDIAALLNMRLENGPFIGSVDRPEIRYFVERCDNKSDRDLRVAQIVDAFKRASAVVYVPTRNDTIRIAGLLRSFGHRVRPYSGAMDFNERQHTEDAFRHGEIDVVVATKAFGLGIDKPDIALIVHLEMPASIEEYVQETGRVARGAREGIGPQTGTAVLLVKPRDCSIHERFVRSAAPDAKTVKEIWSHLQAGANFINPDDWPYRGARPSSGEAESASESSATAGNGDDNDERKETTALALHYLEQVGAVRRRPDFVIQGRVSILDDGVGLRQGQRFPSTPLSEAEQRLLKLVEEKGGEYSGLAWSDHLGLTPTKIEAALFDLQRRDVCDFKSWRYGWVYERLGGAVVDWERLADLITGRRDAVKRRARLARELAHSRPSCRRREMLRYLGESADSSASAQMCGACDACTPDLPRPWAAMEIDREHAADAQREGAPALLFILIDSVGSSGWSRRNLVRTLRGDSAGKYRLHEMLRSHSVFGRLAILDADEVDEIIDEQIDYGNLEEVTVEGRDYKTLRLTRTGRDVLGRRFPR